MNTITVKNIGTLSYNDALELQMLERSRVETGTSAGTIFILQHDPPVITLGRNAAENIKISEEELHGLGIQLRRSSRGGGITAHEPGQVVVYFVVPIKPKETGRFIQRITDILIHFIDDAFSLDSYYDPKRPGIWVGTKKVCSLGFDLTGKASMHGIALNVSNTLEVFKLIEPCGLASHEVASLSIITGSEVNAGMVMLNIADIFSMIRF